MAKPKETPQEAVTDEKVVVDAPVEQTTDATATAVPEASSVVTHDAAQVDMENPAEVASHEQSEGDTVHDGNPELDGTSVEDTDEANDVAEAEESFPEETTVQDKRPVRYALAGIGVGLLVGFCFNFAVTGVQDLIKSSSATAITVAVADCNLDGRDGVSVSEGNKRLSIDTKGSADDSGASTQNAVCLVQALQVPEDVLAKLNETKPDGTSHKEEWDKREMTWEFSGDKGIKMDILIKS
jgi:hypothetical protein